MKKMFRLRAMDNFQAAKKSGGQVIYKTYNAGQKFTGYRDNGSDVPGTLLKIYRTADGFVIPVNSVYCEGPVQKKSSFEGVEEAKVIDNKDYYNKDQIKAVGNIIKTKAQVFENIKKSKAAMNTAVVCAGIGFIYAVTTGKNKYLFLTFGAVGGFILGTTYTNFTDDTKK